MNFQALAEEVVVHHFLNVLHEARAVGRADHAL
jgi:hypothetical protein